MTPVSFLNNGTPVANTAAPSLKPAASVSGQAADSLQLSPAAQAEVGLTGRVALNQEAGNLTSNQAQQLYGQISAIHSQIVTERQADGGTLSPTDALAVRQAQSQVGQTIYNDAHNGTAPPAGATASPAAERQALLAGRIVLNEKAGKLSSDQAQQFGAQLGTIQQQIADDEQANGGTLSSSSAQAINQLQSQLSQQIHTAVHGYEVGPEPVVPPV